MKADIKEKAKKCECRMCTKVFIATFLIAVSLIVGGFLVPPMGVIDGSVLTAVGELIIFPSLAFGMRAVELGYDLKLSHGQTQLNISNNDDGREERNNDSGSPVRPASDDGDVDDGDDEAGLCSTT